MKKQIGTLFVLCCLLFAMPDRLWASTAIPGTNGFTPSASIFFNSLDPVHSGSIASLQNDSISNGMPFSPEPDHPGRSVFPDLMVGITGNLSFCTGGSTLLTATPGFSSYLWTGGSTSQTLNVTIAGTYSVTATDAFGVTSEASVVVLENPFTPPTITGGTVLCPGNTLTLTAAGGNYQTYTWSNAQTTPSITVSTAGAYSVTVTAANGCTGTASTFVLAGNPTTTTILGNTTICNGGSTTLIATGSFASYVWSNSATGSIISVNQPGVYTVTVTTTQGCTGTATATVTDGASIVVNINPPPQPICENGGPIQLQASPPGGVWSGNVSPTGVINPSVLGAGTWQAIYTVTTPNGCTATNQVAFIIQPLTPVSIFPAGPFCANASVQTLSATPAGGVWGGAANALGQFNPALLGPGNYQVTYQASQPGSCPNQTAILVQVNPPPTAFISGSGIICEGSGQSAALTLNVTGNAPIQVTYTVNGGSPTTLTLFAGATTINVSQPGSYQIIEVVDGGGCQGIGNGLAEVVLAPAIQISNLDIQCDPVQGTYTVTFGISGGDPGSYLVNSGTVSASSPYVFTSFPIPSGSPYSFVVSDANNCVPIVLSGDFTCPCATNAGTMNLTPLVLCGNTPASALFNNNATLDANDALVFMLHTGSGNALGSILGISTSPNFGFSPPLIAGETYYISAVAGNSNGSGGVNLNDPCLSVAQGTPVRWTALPTGSLLGPAEICLGETATLVFSLSGNGPFDVTYSDGLQQFVLQNILNNFSVNVSPAATTVYTLELLSDNSTPACSTSPGDGLVLVVNPVDSSFVNASTCDPAQTGVFTNILTAQNGCDSVVVTTVTFSAADSTFLSGSTCDPLAAGVFVETLTNQTGCDSIVTTTITLLPGDTTAVFSTSCDPAQTGVFTNILTAQNGCDSVVVTTVTFSAADSTFLSGSTCDPLAAGVFVETLTNQTGCDSIVTTTIVLLPGDTTAVFSTSCDPAQTGVFTSILTAQNGCDSVVVTTVTFSAADSTFLSGSTCDPLAAGVFVETLTNQTGCDSIVTTTIVLLPGDTTAVFSTSCDAAQTGVFTNILTAQNGCDSVVVTTVTFSAADSTFLSGSTCDPLAAGVFVETLTNQTGCDSIVTTTIVLLPGDTTAVFSTSCDPAQTGVFTNILTAQNGCDSVVVTTVTFSAADSTFLSGSTCDPLAAGVFVETLTNQTGCDSIVTTTIVLLPGDTTAVFSTSCDAAQTGVFTNILTAQNGCDSVVVTTVTFSAADSTFLSGSTCDPLAAGVFVETLTNQTGCDSIVTTTITLLTGDTTAVFSTSCDPAQTGVFTSILTAQNGCDSVVVTTVTFSAADSTFLSGSTCDPLAAGVFVETLTNQTGCDSIVTTTIVLLPGDTTAVFSTSCDPAQTGVFTSILTAQNGCDSVVVTTVTLAPPGECGIEFLLAADTIPCGVSTGTLTIQVLQGQLPLSYTLTGSLTGEGVVNTSPFFLQSLPGGQYTLTLTLPNGLSATETIDLIQAAPPTVVAVQTSLISCNGAADGAATALVTGDFPMYMYQWSNGAVSSDVENLGPGAYAVTVSGAYGCTATAALTIDEPLPVELTLIVNDPGCFELNGGTVQVGVSGGVAPYRYTLNGGDAQAGNSFDGLASGVYEIRVQDAGDCETTEVFLVNVPVSVEVDLGDDLLIRLGDGTVINAIVNLPDSLLETIIWTTTDTLACPGCLSQPVAPLITTSYSIFVETTDGCTDEDNLTVFVDRTKQVYVPSAFSPNNDGNNDVFFLQAKQGVVVNVRSFSVFSRWGEAVFKATNFLPNDPVFGWNGTHRGVPLNSAVFVWLAEMEFVDGIVEIFKGDVVLMR